MVNISYVKWDKEQFKPEKIQLDMKQQTHFQLNLKRINVIYAKWIIF